MKLRTLGWREGYQQFLKLRTLGWKEGYEQEFLMFQRLRAFCSNRVHNNIGFQLCRLLLLGSLYATLGAVATFS